jgi:hypothetical protein
MWMVSEGPVFPAPTPLLFYYSGLAAWGRVGFEGQPLGH